MLLLGSGEVPFKKGVKELGARALQPYLRVNDQITSLKFEEGDLGDAGLRILVDACTSNASLASLACMNDDGITGKVVVLHSLQKAEVIFRPTRGSVQPPTKVSEHRLLQEAPTRRY